MTVATDSFIAIAEIAQIALDENLALWRALRLKIGRPSFWKGRSIGRYIEHHDGELAISGPFPADFIHGRLISPTANLFAGSSPMRTNVDPVVALAITITDSSWQAPEIAHRLILQGWARRIDGPVFVNPTNDRHPWHATYWLFDSTGCSRRGEFWGKCDPRGLHP